jgi:hypothetical protein
MANSVAVLFVHGINVSDQNYYLETQSLITNALRRDLRPHVAFSSVFWASEVRPRQRRYLDEVTRAGIFRDDASRRFVVEGLGDAAAYQKTKKRKNAAYYDIQSRLRDGIRHLDERGHENRPLVIIAHSLGCQIASSFAWDVNTYKQMAPEQLAHEDDESQQYAAYLKSGSPFRRLDTLAGIVTMGSNQPLFTFMYEPETVIPITRSRGPHEVPAFPGAALPAEIAAKAKWLNFFSRNDLLGYPLKQLHNGYREEARLSDIEVASEGVARRYFWPSPLNAVAAHAGYWTHHRVIDGAAKLIAELIIAGAEPPRGRFAQTFKARKRQAQVT